MICNDNPNSTKNQYKYIPEFRGCVYDIKCFINALPIKTDKYIAHHIISYLDYTDVLTQINKTASKIEWSWDNRIAVLKIDISTGVNDTTNQTLSVKQNCQRCIINKFHQYLYLLVNAMGPTHLIVKNNDITINNEQLFKFIQWLKQFHNIKIFSLDVQMIILPIEEITMILTMPCKSFNFICKYIDYNTSRQLQDARTYYASKQIHVKSSIMS